MRKHFSPERYHAFRPWAEPFPGATRRRTRALLRQQSRVYPTHRYVDLAGPRFLLCRRAHHPPVTPPGKGAHVLTYGKDGQLASYVAPGASPIVVGYDGDRDLGKVTYEDGTATDVVRDAAGRPSRLVYAGGEVAFAYDAASGKLRTLTTTSGQGLTFGWDGALLRDVTATGVAPGTMASTYDTMLRQATESASGNVVSFAYDVDGLLTRAGPVFLTREPASGRLASLSVGLAGETFGYTGYGELSSYQARSASGVLLDMALAQQPVDFRTEAVRRPRPTRRGAIRGARGAYSCRRARTAGSKRRRSGCGGERPTGENQRAARTRSAASRRSARTA